jgi:hypothetical protein
MQSDEIGIVDVAYKHARITIDTVYEAELEYFQRAQTSKRASGALKIVQSDVWRVIYSIERKLEAAGPSGRSPFTVESEQWRRLMGTFVCVSLKSMSQIVTSYLALSAHRLHGLVLAVLRSLPYQSRFMSADSFRSSPLASRSPPQSFQSLHSATSSSQSRPCHLWCHLKILFALRRCSWYVPPSKPPQRYSKILT